MKQEPTEVNLSINDRHGRNPRQTSANFQDDDRNAKQLIEAFIANFKKFQVSPEIIAAGSQLIPEQNEKES